MVAEAEHKKGEEGAYLVKRYLDSTTHVNVTFTAYEDQVQTSLLRLDGTFKRYDLTGFFIGDNRRPLYVEVKNYSTVGKQAEAYDEFICDAYSTLVMDLENKADRRIEFMWATWHPFSQGKWQNLTSHKYVRSCVQAKVAVSEEFLGGRDLDDDHCRMLSDRLWLVPMYRRQDELSLTREELFRVHSVLQRKGLF